VSNLRIINKSFIIQNMNTTIAQQNTNSIKPANLATWLLSHGITTVTADECAHLLGVADNEVSQRLKRYRDRGQFVSLARGLWGVVSPEYREMGAPEPISYIDQLMKYSGCEYCIGWLSAAALQGASHQAPQVFQIATAKNMVDRTVGRNSLQFHTRSYVSHICKKRINTPQGAADVAVPGAVMLMAVSDILVCGGIDNAATIIAELAEENPSYMNEVLACVHLFPLSAARRLGWILEHVAEEDGLEGLAVFCKQNDNPAMLSPYETRRGRIDSRWNIIINREIEADI